MHIDVQYRMAALAGSKDGVIVPSYHLRQLSQSWNPLACQAMNYGQTVRLYRPHSMEALMKAHRCLVPSTR